MVNRKYTSRKRTKRGGRRRKTRRRKTRRRRRGGTKTPKVGIWLTVKRLSKLRNRFKYLKKKKKTRK